MLRHVGTGGNGEAVVSDWLRVTAINGDDYECHMTVLKADDTTITITRPWRHH